MFGVESMTTSGLSTTRKWEHWGAGFLCNVTVTLQPVYWDSIANSAPEAAFLPRGSNFSRSLDPDGHLKRASLTLCLIETLGAFSVPGTFFSSSSCY
jgi:hypothetical protein